MRESQTQAEAGMIKVISDSEPCQLEKALPTLILNTDTE